MATQSLYRRYRPRRFAELKGQEHIVRALRTSVAEGREGQAYLFSGPRGTGKTTTARIMAKVLNCSNPTDGEPCCECDSCTSVESGTSYDVHELDAASNNGVDAMRDLIEKASLGTPGRHKVYILDEVHMLSKGAEAALLKTLEEPPPHVVFVLATTDPQKMSDTIRSRTQHLQFHLLGPDTLQDHVRWVAQDAGLTVTDEAIEQVVAQGAGSPRDTLSALELVSNAGGGAVEVIALDEFVEAMIEHEPGRALKMVAHAISRGRDPRTISEELVAFLRNGFLSLMAPELVQLPSQRMDALGDLARRLGPAGLVRGIEVIGTSLTEMRNAPDPRVLLDVATVQLTSEQVSSNDVSALAARLAQLERQVASGAPATAPPATASPGDAVPRPAAVAPLAAESASEPETAVAAPVDPATGRAKLGSRLGTAAPAPAEPEPAPAAAESEPAAPAPPDSAPAPESAPDPDPAPAPAPTPAPTAASLSAADWDAVRPNLRGITRAMFAPAGFVRAEGSCVVLSLPNEAHRQKCEQHRTNVEQAMSAHADSPVTVELVVEGAGPSGGGGGAPTPAPATPAPVASAPAPAPASAAPPPSAGASTASGALAAEPTPSTDTARLEVVPPVVDDPVEETLPDDHPAAGEMPGEAPGVEAAPPVVNGREIAERARAAGPAPDPEDQLRVAAQALPDDDEVDLDELIDAPPEDVKTPVDRLAEAFPGSTFVEEDRC